MNKPATILWPVTVGEVPEPYEEAWDDVDGTNLDLDGFTGSIQYRVNGGTRVTRACNVGPVTSTTLVTWQASDYAAPGVMAGEVVVTDGTSTYMRPFRRVINAARGGV